MSFSQEIIHWYQANKRSLPWRETKDPYHIWLSEIILQQTRVAQGTPYYVKFTDAFPTVFDLAAAPEEQVLKLWQGLGYYSRARNLHAAAQYVVNELNGVFPANHKALLQLKGVGDYTASAIASICFNSPEAVLDGNVYRVLSRYFGIDVPVNTTEGARLFKAIALDQLDLANPSDYNQAIMEFGALQCTPKLTDCPSCPLQSTCVAYRTQKVTVLPVKLPKQKPVKVYHYYFVFVDPFGNTLYEKRTGKGIWEGLYQFPLATFSAPRTVEGLLTSMETALDFSLYENAKHFVYHDTYVVHKLTHRHIYATFIVIETAVTLKKGMPFGSIDQFPTAVLISDFINAFKNSYF
ncbi:A/G-specific adenine glycosylase [Flavobacteriaceae bacterium]|nr:A/G-specific adenine glycosylase [Flavobacteriaceae bacterium]